MIRLDPTIAALLEAGERLIVPSRQRAAAVRLALTFVRRERDVPWSTPEVVSQRGWILGRVTDSLRDGGDPLPRVLDPQEEWLAWRRAAHQWLGAQEFGSRGSLTPESLADALQRSAGVAHDWEIPSQRLADDPSMEARCLAASIDDVQQFARERDALAAHEVSGALARRRIAPADIPEHVIGPVTPAFARLGVGRWTVVDETRTRAPTPRLERVVDPRDPMDEVLRAAWWCRRKLEHDPWARVLVVVPALATRRELIERVFREVLTPRKDRDDVRTPAAFVLEGGMPIAEYAEPGEALETLVRLTRSADDETLASLLEAQFWGAAHQAVRARVALQLRTSGARRIPPREFAVRLRQFATDKDPHGEAARTVIEVCAARIEEAIARLQSPDAGRCKAALRILGFPWEGELDSDREQVRRHWEGWLEACERRVFDRSRRPLAESMDLIRHLARRERFAPSSGDVPVTITGALEPPVVRYDGVRVLGLQADRWPEPVQFDPFLPWAMQAGSALPAASAERRLNHARRLMQAWRACADELVWSWAHGEEETPWQPSPLLPSTHEASHEGSRCRAVDAPDLATQLRAGGRVSLEAYQDELGVAYVSDRPIPGGSRALSDQAECPFRAYARHRLGARSPDLAQPGISALTRGLFLHRALWYFWSRVGDSATLAKTDASVLDESIEAAIRECQVDRQDPLTRRLIGRETDRARRVLGALIANETARPAFRIAALETPLELVLGSARIALQIDRADRLEDGALVVIDYKTGRHRSVHFRGPLTDAIQLWLYAEAMERDERWAGASVRAIGQLHLVSAGKSWSALRADDCALPEAKASPDWPAIRAEARELLESLARDFVNGCAGVTPRAQACRHCDLTAVCRRTVLLGGDHSESDALEENDP